MFLIDFFHLSNRTARPAAVEYAGFLFTSKFKNSPEFLETDSMKRASLLNLFSFPALSTADEGGRAFQENTDTPPQQTTTIRSEKTAGP